MDRRACVRRAGRVPHGPRHAGCQPPHPLTCGLNCSPRARLCPAPSPACPQYPSYYTQPFHAYPEGNLALEPALEMTVAARRWAWVGCLPVLTAAHRLGWCVGADGGCPHAAWRPASRHSIAAPILSLACCVPCDRSVHSVVYDPEGKKLDPQVGAGQPQQSLAELPALC